MSDLKDLARAGQRRTIIGACDYSIAYMRNLKQDLSALDSPNPELSWAVGGIIATLVSNLTQVCDQVFQESVASGKSDAKEDLKEITVRFGEFIGRMINAE